MKKKITFIIDELTSQTDGVYHKTNIIEINKQRDFNPDTKALEDIELTRDDEDDDSIFRPTVIIDFPRLNSKFFMRTTPIMSDGTRESSSRIVTITQTGLNLSYQHSETIIKTPKVMVGGKTVNGYRFVTSEFRVFKGLGTHTSTTWRLTKNGRVVWEREDTTNLLEIVIPMELETSSLYIIEAIHHAGDSDSATGRNTFTTSGHEEHVFEIRDKNGKSLENIDIEAHTLNMLEFAPKRLDIANYSWEISNDKTTFLTDTVLTRDDTEIGLVKDVIAIDGRLIPDRHNLRLRVFTNINASTEVQTLTEFKDKNGLEEEVYIGGQTIEDELTLLNRHWEALRDDNYPNAVKGKVYYNIRQGDNNVDEI